MQQWLVWFYPRFSIIILELLTIGESASVTLWESKDLITECVTCAQVRKNV